MSESGWVAERVLRAAARVMYGMILVAAGVATLFGGLGLALDGGQVWWVRLAGVGLVVLSFLVYRFSFRVGVKLLGAPSNGHDERPVS